jgi:hypothetical protein
VGSEREAVVTTMEDSVRVELSWSRLGAWNMLHWVGRVEYRDQRTQVAALGGTGKRGGVKIRGGGRTLRFRGLRSLQLQRPCARRRETRLRR